MERTGLFLNSGPESSDEDLIATAQLADSLGYDSIWTGESWGRDAFTFLTMIACHTQNVRLGTGIVTVYSRTPGLIAQSVASLDQISKGRAILGLGSSGKAVIEGWHGVPFDSPLARTKEYVQIIRTALTGGPVNHDGKFFKLARFRMMAAPVQTGLPIYLASLGPKNLELTGQLADGWLPIWVHRPSLAGLREQIAQASLGAGRGASAVTAAPYIICYAADEAEDLAHGEQLVRAHMAYYIGGMGPYYFDSFCRAGFTREADAVREAWQAGDRPGAAAAISQNMVENVAVVGTAAQCRDQLNLFRAAGADMPIVSFPHGASTQAMRRTLEALAPSPDSTEEAAAG